MSALLTARGNGRARIAAAVVLPMVGVLSGCMSETTTHSSGEGHSVKQEKNVEFTGALLQFLGTALANGAFSSPDLPQGSAFSHQAADFE